MQTAQFCFHLSLSLWSVSRGRSHIHE